MNDKRTQIAEFAFDENKDITELVKKYIGQIILLINSLKLQLASNKIQGYVIQLLQNIF